MEVTVRKQDQILMSLVHYFVTKENYSPIFVQGVKDEIWLEKLDGPYRVIRINSNYIHNDEQFKVDQYKILSILRQIKKKTFSFSINALNINLNANDNIEEKSVDNIDNIKLESIKEAEENELLTDIFPNLKGNLFEEDGGLDLIFNVTKDINERTERENKRFEKIFAPKKIYVNKLIMALCVLMYVVSLIISSGGSNFNYTLVILGANNIGLLKEGQVFRLITYAFLHGGIFHLLMNMYCLSSIGNQVESRFGKIRYLTIYLISAICGGLLSAAFSAENAISIGASGAIFGVLGALTYFCVCYRLYLKDELLSSIIPVILINLFLGFSISGIDIWCHIGGLISGYLAAMAVGITETKKKKDRINGTLMLLIFVVFLIYLVFFR